MALFLECIEGPADGEKFRLENGVRIGRLTGEILLDDNKVSSLHAQVESSDKGQLFLVDRGSSNGLKIDGRKVQKVALLPGVRLQIGRHFFRVIDFEVEVSPFVEEHPETTWKHILAQMVPKVSAQNNSRAAFVRKFDSLLELEFLQGIQAETKVTLGYGPRKAGSDVLDIELQDPVSPDIAFELIPDEDGSVRFRTSFPELVLLNEAHVSSDTLKAGDQIRVGDTLIEVKFLK